jgi:predicted SAM-dependent methyltransferase
MAPLVERARRAATPGQLRQYDKIHLGSGPRQMQGWANLDIAGKGNLIWDLRKPLPLAPGSIRLVFTEHFIEHISREDGEKLLAHCWQAMAPGAVVRISTPDLRAMIRDYSEGKLIQIPHAGYYPKTLCQMVNEGMRLWGHTFIYDEDELRELLAAAGFVDIKRVAPGESAHPELSGLETRPNFDDLILEAVRP